MNPFQEYFDNYFASRVNTGGFAASYTLPELDEAVFSKTFALPVVSLGMPSAKLPDFGDLVLPPLFLQAMDQDLREGIINRILQSFPYHPGTKKRQRSMGNLKVIEYPSTRFLKGSYPEILGFSVDPAVEQHGPHLPLGTESLISHHLLSKLGHEENDFAACYPVDYGSLSWSTPHGFSIDIGADFLTRYLQGYANAIMQWAQPKALYVVMSHGNKAHRKAVEEGLERSECRHWKTRWLLESATEDHEGSDIHAGGLHTSLLNQIAPNMIDSRHWPETKDDLIENQFCSVRAQKDSHEPFDWIDAVEDADSNGIFGDLSKMDSYNAPALIDSMILQSRKDIESLRSGI